VVRLCSGGGECQSSHTCTRLDSCRAHRERRYAVNAGLVLGLESAQELQFALQVGNHLAAAVLPLLRLKGSLWRLLTAAAATARAYAACACCASLDMR
jgi:hypothetical protein